MKPDFRLLVCGGLNYDEPNVVSVALDALLAKNASLGEMRLVVIQGGAAGADKCARMWALARGLLCETFHADWRRNGKAAGPIRNQQMLDSGVNMVAAFPGGRGTADMMRRARAAGIPVFDFAAELTKHWPAEQLKAEGFIK